MSQNPTTAEFFGYYAELVRRKEEALGHPAEDGPSYRDMEFLCKGLHWLDSADAKQPPAEIHALMELISDVRDAWADPDNDPIGSVLFPVLSEVHNALGLEMDKANPESAETRQRVEDLRALQRAIRRTLLHKRPSAFDRIVSKVRSLLGKRQ